jgi:hypothetical protein
MKLPIYMKAGKDKKTIIVKWWGIIYLKLRYVFLSNVRLSDESDNCPLFDKCKNPLKDEHCDDNMAGSQYCFKD